MLINIPEDVAQRLEQLAQQQERALVSSLKLCSTTMRQMRLLVHWQKWHATPRKLGWLLHSGWIPLSTVAIS
jgi:hypothetical protein